MKTEWTRHILFVVVLGFLTCHLAKAQNLFLEECFVGGVTTGGANSAGSLEGSICEIKWESDYTLRAAYAITYRYGRPENHSMFINDTPVFWNQSNQ